MNPRWSVLGLVLLAGLPLSLQAQTRGGGGTRGGTPRPVASAPAPPPAPAPASIHPILPFTSNPVTPFGRAPVSGPVQTIDVGRGYSRRAERQLQTIVVLSEPLNPYSSYYSPYPASPALTPWLYPNFASSVEPREPLAQSTIAAQTQIDLTFSVRQLAEQIEMLRRDQAERESAAAAQPRVIVPSAPQLPPEPVSPTVLVFRDGHQTTVQNYAVAGETLWILDGATTKIAIGDLDLNATQRANGPRGARMFSK